MSLGNEFDDSGYERSAVLYEAAVQMVVNRLSRETAVSEAEQLQVQRQDAEQADEVEKDEQGNAVSYFNKSLNTGPLTDERRETVGSIYAELCADEGLDPA